MAQDGKTCYDWLKFIDGIPDESDNTTIFCNNGPNPLDKIFSSKHPMITLWMYSDNAESGKGKKALNTSKQYFFSKFEKIKAIGLKRYSVSKPENM